jgi:thiamine pyrophosphokinase
MARDSRVAIVLVGGDPVRAEIRAVLPPNALVIAADSGLHLASVVGLHVDVIVGDFDSAEPDAVETAVGDGARVERHPAEKDATDLELALASAAGAGVERIVVVGGAGGRLDHFLANMTLLASTRWAGIAIEARVADAWVAVARGGEPAVDIEGPQGALVTLLPAGGAARGITTKGLQYALHADDLEAGTSRGVSNVITDPPASVALAAGTLLVVRP